MKNREKMRDVLDDQLKLWSAKPFEQLIAELKETKDYEVDKNSATYQVEVDLLENTEEYVHVGIGVDDGRLLSSIFPLSDSFVLKKSTGPAACPAIPEPSEGL